jgi:4-amino-4-deoxy-L-arabinose transferase-like glycosyltransferase
MNNGSAGIRKTGPRRFGERCAAAFLALVCLAVLFANLGGPGFFEPDEGRNAEKAREILLLNDWVTPHHNFLPTLDKPMGFFWPVALSFKLFGFSEWAARLTSALAALGCLLVVYRFALRRWGLREAVWSCLTLLTCVGFFGFARLVIFDMSLTFFLTVTLVSFYSVARADDPRRHLFHSVVMYVALGAGTLIKGAVAVVLPGMVILSYILLTRQWFLLRRLGMTRGALIYLGIVTPWYLWSEAKNPGYLRYFLWEEHFVRYTTAEFERSEGWYYFIAVVVVGFFPWSSLLPQVARDMWRKSGEDTHRFLALWVLLPVIFFSFSKAQLPQYILPIFPSLALLTGRFLAERYSAAEAWRSVLLPWLGVVGAFLYLIFGAVWPDLVVSHIRTAVAQNFMPLVLCGVAVLVIGGICLAGYLKKLWSGWQSVYISTATALALFFLLAAQMITEVSLERGARSIVGAAAPFIDAEDRVVFYDTHLASVAFYLSLDRPAWIVQKEEKEKIMGSTYLAERRPAASGGHGQVVFSFSEFAQLWNRQDLVMRIFVKEKNLQRLSSNVGATPKILTQFDEYLLVSNR